MTLIFRGPTQHRDPSGINFEQVEANVLIDDAQLVRGLDRLAMDIHAANRIAGWWSDLHTGADLLETRNRGEMLMLCVTELSEAEQGCFEQDDKLPQYHGMHVEVADFCIRLLDLLGAEQRRGGQQPLITYNLDHGRVSVASCYRDFEALAPRSTRDALMRIVRDVSTAFDDGYRKDKVRLARYWLTSALFRVIAFAARERIDLFTIIEAKCAYNRSRADHKRENRVLDGGKKC